MSDIYEKVQKRLDLFPQGFPKTASGVELKILRRLMTPEEAEILLALRPSLEPASAVAARSSRDAKEMEKQLYEMSRKGLILRIRIPDGTILYRLAPWIVGIWEFQLKNLDKEFAELSEQFTEEGLVPERKKSKISGMRTIPIEKEVAGITEVQPYEKISEMLNVQKKFAVMDCICRKEQKLMGKGCDKLMEACLTLGMFADFCIENGMAREITREEANEILRKAEEQGLVHCSANEKTTNLFICNCCGCCCGVLRGVNKYNIPTAMTKSNYYAKIDPDECTGCESCVDRCQVNAIYVQDGSAKIEKARCIGCGLCVSACPTEAISMAHKEKEDMSVIFPDSVTLLQAIGEEKGKAYPFE